MSESHGVPETDAIERCIGVSRHSARFRRRADEAVSKLTALRARLEAAERENRWVPVSERLPEPYRAVFTQTVDGTYVEQHIFPYNGICGSGVMWSEVAPLAWQELPAPYQPTGETTCPEAQ